jgi:hypothetical protein
MFKYILFALLVFSGCSQKSLVLSGEYKTKNTNDIFKITQQNKDIKFISKQTIIYNDGGWLSKSNDGKSSEIPLGFKAINSTNANTIFANDDGDVVVLSSNVNKKLDKYSFGLKVIAASIRDDILIVLFANNSVEIYDIVAKETKYKKYFLESNLNSSKIAQPIFFENFIFVPLLNGSIAIFNYSNTDFVRSMSVHSNQDEINNITYLDVINDSIVSATNNKLFVFKENSIIKDYNIKAIFNNEDFIYISTLDGRIIQFDYDLNVLHTKKYNFGDFVSIGYLDYFYAYESSGKLMAFDDELNEKFILNVKSTKKAKFMNNKLYISNEILELK